MLHNRMVFLGILMLLGVCSGGCRTPTPTGADTGPTPSAASTAPATQPAAGAETAPVPATAPSDGGVAHSAGATDAGPAVSHAALLPLAQALLDRTQIAFDPTTRTLALGVCWSVPGEGEGCRVEFRPDGGGPPELLEIFQPKDDHTARIAAGLPKIAARLAAGHFLALRRVALAATSQELTFPGAFQVRLQLHDLEVRSAAGGLLASWSVHPAHGFQARLAAVHVNTDVPWLVAAVEQLPDPHATRQPRFIEHIILPLPPDLVKGPLLP